MADLRIEPHDDLKWHAALAHSKMVRRFRIFLPLAAAILIIVCTIWVFFEKTTDIDLKFTSTGLENGRLVMNNPQLEGKSTQGTPFQVTANRATQDPFVPKIIDLEKVLATLPLGNGLSGILTAAKGRYNSAVQTIQLNDNIFFEFEDGSYLSMKDGMINLLNGWLKTDQMVEILYADGTLKAGAMAITHHGRKARFSKGVQLIIPPKLLAEPSF